MRYWRWYSCLFGSVVLWMSFPPVNVGWLAIPGIALLVLSIQGSTLNQAFILGFTFAAVFNLLLLHWLTIVGFDAWVLLSLVCALWSGLMGTGIALVSRHRLWPALIPGMWIAQEWVRGTWPFGGFPWGTVAFSQADTSIGRTSTLVGMLGTSGWVVLCACVLVAVVRAIKNHEPKSTFITAGWFIVLVAIPALIPIAHGGDSIGGVASTPIGLVQGGTPSTGMSAFDVRRAVLDNHVRETMTLATAIAQKQSTKPTFVLWPENSSDLDPYRDEAAAAAIGVAVRSLNVPVLVGAVVNNPQDASTILNAGILWDPLSGPGQQYNKKHPVPFGEYIPFRDLLAPLISRFDRIGRDFAAGTATGIFTIGGVDAGNLICFEVAYNSVTGALVDEGARVITVQTNNATYADTAQPEQQFMIERMRALETGRSVVVAATTGISAFIRPDGSVQAMIGEGSTGSLVRDVSLRGQRNLGSVVAPYVTLLWAGSALFTGLFFAVRAIHARRARQHKVVQ